MFSFTTLAKRAFLLACFYLTLTLFPLPSYALTVQDVPNPRVSYGGWVTDLAQILSLRTEAQLNQIISKLEHENGAEIAVVTVAETAPSPTPKAFTTELFNNWRIGKKDLNNGVLFLVSVGDRRVEIETGYGVRNILSNADVSKIIQEIIIPQFKEGNFEHGILAGTKLLMTKLSAYQSITTQNSTYSKNFLLPVQSITKRNLTKSEKRLILFFLLFTLVVLFLIVVFWVLFKLSPKVDNHNNYSGGEQNSFSESDGSGSSFNLKMMIYKSNESHYYCDGSDFGHRKQRSSNPSKSSGNGSYFSGSSGGDSSSLSDGGSGGDFGGGSSGGDGGGGGW